MARKRKEASEDKKTTSTEALSEALSEVIKNLKEEVSSLEAPPEEKKDTSTEVLSDVIKNLKEEVDLFSWDGVYQAQTKFHLGALSLDIQEGQFILVSKNKLEVNFIEHPNLGFEKVAKTNWVKKVDFTKEQVFAIWKEEIAQPKTGPKDPVKVPMATWRG